ncbi:hypothetical protein BX600DRAFT_399566, partial [Xylariales sp. PMI_506]
MSMILAPYNDAMRIGQGFNSYTHELCIDSAVLVNTENHDNDEQSHVVESPAQVSGPTFDRFYKVAYLTHLQVVSYSARVVEKLSDIVESMNVSYCSSIKKGTVAVSGSSSTIDETTFKSADLNLVVTVKVTNQTTIIKDNAEFQKIEGIEPGTTLFNESYGDSYISGFIEGGEFTGIISLKVLDRTRVDSTIKTIKSSIDSGDKSAAAGEMTLDTHGSGSSKSFSSALRNTESHISVSWMGGGQIKDEKTLWDVNSVFAAAAAFPKRVSERPQRTWAILTKYKSNKTFVAWSRNKLFKALEYDQVTSYTAELFDSYMDYKLLLKDLQVVIDDRDSFQPRSGVMDALDSSMETLLSVRSAMREEQTKIIEAINVLSRDPGILKRQGTWSAGRRSEKVQAILKRALGPWATEVLTGAAPAISAPPMATSDSGASAVISPSGPEGVVALEDDLAASTTLSNPRSVTPPQPAPELEFNFATLVPAEVWRNVMPVRKPTAPSTASAAPPI